MPLSFEILWFIWAFYLNFWHVQGKIYTHVSDNYFDGFGTFLPVRRSMLQKRLDEINNGSVQNAVKFFLPPEGTVFPDILTRDQHVVLIGYGQVVATSFEESLTCAQKESFDTRPDTLSFNIPFLTSHPGGLPQLNLALSRYTSPKTDVVDPNFAITPKLPADELKYTCNQSFIGISFSHGKNLKMEMSGEVSNSCGRPPDKFVNDFTLYADERLISLHPPDFSICDRFGDINVDFCNVWRSNEEDITKSGSNVCQFWTHARNVTTCQLSIKVIDMSRELRDMLALPYSEETEAIKAEKVQGFYGIGLISPCV